ncbi:hypothetical protein JCM1841_003365 [Sporobolomyces salmonicolor]
MLSQLLSSRLTSTSPPLVVLSDTLLQPALPLFRQLLLSSPSSHVVLLAAEQLPSRLLPAHVDRARLSVVDCTLAAPFASTSTSSAVSVDLSAGDALEQLESAVVGAVEESNKGAGVPVVVAVDSANALADEVGVHGVCRIIKRSLKALEGCPTGSRLLLLHHQHFPSLPSSSGSFLATPSLLATLLSPTVSPSTLHLSLHAPALLEVLSRDYGLSLPSPLSLEDEVDLRLPQFLARLEARGVGDPFRRPERAEEEDERIPLDGLGQGSGAGREGCAVLGWTARGLQLPGSGAGGKRAAAPGEVRKVVSWGYEGLRRSEAGDGVREVRLGEVLDPVRMGKVRGGAEAVPSPQPTDTPSSSSSARPPFVPPSLPPFSSTPTTATAPLPFSLSLTPSQLLARSRVANPFEGANKPIFGEAGYSGPTEADVAARAQQRGGGGLTVEYTPDRGDDWDDEDPDEDLEI